MTSTIQRSDRTRYPRRTERRGNPRYPIDTALVYKLIRQGRTIEAGFGRTVDVSSSGILFESARSLPPGMQIEISMAWPARLSDAVDLQLCVLGLTVRGQDKRTAVIIRRHEFRTKRTRDIAGAQAFS